MGTTTPTAERISFEPWTLDRGPIQPQWTVGDLMAARCISIGELSRAAGISWQAAWRAAVAPRACRRADASLQHWP